MKYSLAVTALVLSVQSVSFATTKLAETGRIKNEKVSLRIVHPNSGQLLMIRRPGSQEAILEDVVIYYEGGAVKEIDRILVKGPELVHASYDPAAHRENIVEIEFTIFGEVGNLIFERGN